MYPSKKSFSIALCVFFSINVVCSTLTACKIHKFQYFSFLSRIHLKQTINCPEMQKKCGVVSPKKSFSIALCVFCSVKAMFSTLTACKTHNFEYFSFLSRIHLKQTMNYLEMHQKSGVVSPKKKFLYCLVCVLLY